MQYFVLFKSLFLYIYLLLRKFYCFGVSGSHKTPNPGVTKLRFLFHCALYSSCIGLVNAQYHQFKRPNKLAKLICLNKKYWSLKLVLWIEKCVSRWRVCYQPGLPRLVLYRLFLNIFSLTEINIFEFRNQLGWKNNVWLCLVKLVA